MQLNRVLPVMVPAGRTFSYSRQSKIGIYTAPLPGYEKRRKLIQRLKCSDSASILIKDRNPQSHHGETGGIQNRIWIHSPASGKTPAAASVCISRHHRKLSAGQFRSFELFQESGVSSPCSASHDFRYSGASSPISATVFEQTITPLIFLSWNSFR